MTSIDLIKIAQLKYPVGTWFLCLRDNIIYRKSSGIFELDEIGRVIDPMVNGIVYSYGTWASFRDNKNNIVKKLDQLEALFELYEQNNERQSQLIGSLNDTIRHLRKQQNGDAIEFAKWLQHLDNGTTHYNPHTKEETESIGFSPCDCFMDNIKTVEELYKLFNIHKK